MHSNYFDGQGGYIFVSHSHKDIAVVRKIRNELEGRGFEPILFYLRCMDNGDEESKTKLRELIQQEINARNFFLYVDSEHARASKWVQDELEYVKSQNKDVKIIQLDDVKNNINEEALKSKVIAALKRANVYLSYSTRDRMLVKEMTEVLLQYDYRVNDPADFPGVGEDWLSSIVAKIEEVARNGIFLCVVTPTFLQSEYCMREYQYALKANAIVVPAFISVPEDDPHRDAFLGCNGINITPDQEGFEHLARVMMNVIS